MQDLPDRTGFPQQHFRIKRGAAGRAVEKPQLLPHEAEIHVAIEQPQQVILGNLLLQAEVVEQRLPPGFGGPSSLPFLLEPPLPRPPLTPQQGSQLGLEAAVVVDLWPVEDELARQWMTTLYRRRSVDGLSTAQSVHEASLEVLRQRRPKKQSTHPFYWAGFVAAGDCR